MMEKMQRLYILQNGSCKIETQYGYITYLEWLWKEKERIEKEKGRRGEIFSTPIPSHFYGLKVNAHPDCTCEFCKGERKKK